MRPRYSLHDVFALIDSGNYWFSAPSRSYRSVVAVFAKTKTHKTPIEAAAFILLGIKALTEKHFVQTVLQWGSGADVYGLIYEGYPGYIKFMIDEDGLQEISFHLAEKEMITIGGIKIPAGESG
ncbi:hypothetical protein WDW37_13460 [Bdellovibrionota bacterium FG-1]